MPQDPSIAPRGADALVLAIDLGTSAVKAAVVAPDGAVLADGRAALETLRGTENGRSTAEQDPEQVWEAVVAACTAATAQVDGSRIAAIVPTGQYSSIVPLDADGAPTHNMILWQDGRGLRDGYSPLQLLQWWRVHGLPPVADGLSLNHMRYLARHRPDVYRRTAAFLEPIDYVAFRLSGRVTASQCTTLTYLATDNRGAPPTDYHGRLVAAGGIEPAKLPPLVPATSPVGTALPQVATRLGVAPTAVVVSGLIDTQAGAAAGGGFSGGQGVISLGTTSVITARVPRKRTSVRHTMLTMPSPVPHTPLLMAETGLAGAVVTRALDWLGLGDDPSALDALAARCGPGAGGVLFMPWLGGSLTPRESSVVRGGWLNLDAATDPAQLARAVLEGVALTMRWARDPAEKICGRRLDHYVVHGGGARSDLWCQVIADALDRPVHRLPRPGLAVAVGAAMLARRGLGLDDDALAHSPAPERVFTPDAAASATYERLLPAVVRAHRATQSPLRLLRTAIAPGHDARGPKE